jgi:ABC-type Na+ efflux pump permease subunit
MSGGIKPLIRAVVSTGKVAGKATVRSGKAYHNAIEHAPAIKGPVSFVKANKEGIKAAGKGFARGVKSGIKTEKAKAAERVVAEKAKVNKANLVSEEKRLMDDLNNQKKKTQTVNKSSTGKKKLTTKQKVGIGVVTGAAAAGGIKYANRKRRTLND